MERVDMSATTVGWDDLPRDLHREILRLVPLRDATAARGVSREMRDEMDEVWREWGIRASAEDFRKNIRAYSRHSVTYCQLDCGPLVVYGCEGSHAHHLASLGLWWLALLVAEGPDINSISWDMQLGGQSPLMVAVRASRPVGRGADGNVEWEYALGDEEVARMVRVAAELGADLNRKFGVAWPLMTYCVMGGCLEAVKACLAAGAEVDATSAAVTSNGWWTALVHAGRMGHEAVVEALLEAGASAQVGPDGRDETLVAVCGGPTPTPGIVRRLVEAGADVNAQDLNSTDTALRVSTRLNDLAIVEAGWIPGGWIPSGCRGRRQCRHHVGDQCDAFRTRRGYGAVAGGAWGERRRPCPRGRHPTHVLPTYVGLL